MCFRKHYQYSDDSWAYSDMEDAEAVELFNNGEEDVYKYMLEKYMGFIIYLTQNIYISGSDKEDVIQEARIGLYYALRDYKAEKNSSFKNFSAQCITKRVFSAVKAGNRKKHMPLNSYMQILEEDEREVKSIDFDSDPIVGLIQNEDFDCLNKQINDGLSVLEFRILQLYIRGDEYREIARLIGAKEKLVDNALQRVKRKLGKMVALNSKYSIG